MTHEQPTSGGFRAFYQRFFDTLVNAYNTTGDPAVYVYENLLRWKGVPADGFRLQSLEQHVSPHFSILTYPVADAFTVYTTLGASFKIMPDSPISFADERGVRYEYILHGAVQWQQQISDLLLMIAEYPFLHKVEYTPGFVLPIGDAVVPGSGMEYLYFTYPYVDDTRIETGQPWGQIERPQFLIQTLWVFPIYQAEAEYLRNAGMDAFEERINARHQQQYDTHDFFREPYV